MITPLALALRDNQSTPLSWIEEDANFSEIQTAVNALIAGASSGTMTAEGPFLAGVGFVPGTTTQLTLSQAYVYAVNLQIHFDGIYQGIDQYSVSGLVVTFNNPIPVGVNEVYIVGGTTIPINTPATNSVGLAQLTTAVINYFVQQSALSAATGSSIVGFKQLGTGAVATTVQTEIQQHWINAKSFGAVGNTILNGSNAFVSGTDDTAAINAALTYAATQVGAVVYLPHSTGKYKVSSDLNLTGSGVTLTGPGEIYYTLPAFSYQHCVIISGTNCGVENLNFMSDPAALRNSGYGFHVSVNGASNAFVRNCFFYYTPSASVWVSDSTDTQVTGNYVYYPKADGLHFSNGASRFLCQGNIVIGTADDSIASVWDSSPTDTAPSFGVISNNLVAYNIAGNAFNLSQSNNVSCVNNFSYFSASCGITAYLWSGSTFATNLLIEGNYIYQPGQNPTNQAGACGIYVGAMNDSDIIGNVIDSVQNPAAYSNTTTYAVGQLVSSGGVNYICIAITTGNAPPNATYWSVTNICAINVTAYQRLDIKSNSIRNAAGYGIWAPDADPNGPSNMTNLRITDNDFYNIQKRSVEFNLSVSSLNGLFVLNSTFLGSGYTTADYHIYISNAASNTNPVVIDGNKCLDAFSYVPYVNPATVPNANCSGNYPEASFAYSPTITTSTGSITTLGTVVANYMRADGVCFVDVTIPITTNGTGAVDIRCTLPFSNNATIMGIFSGVEFTSTGKGVMGNITSGLVSLKFADGTYPGGSGYSIHFAGWYRTV
jgi:hypothetical protein